jgi:hypothetical protein
VGAGGGLLEEVDNCVSVVFSLCRFGDGCSNGSGDLAGSRAMIPVPKLYSGFGV